LVPFRSVTGCRSRVERPASPVLSLSLLLSLLLLGVWLGGL
jgi:hypothetical protein